MERGFLTVNLPAALGSPLFRGNVRLPHRFPGNARSTGQLLRPTDQGYDDRRRVHNGLIDKRLAVIASCHGVADIVDAVQLARTLRLEVSVRGGGHNVAGQAVVDQGLMIDLSTTPTSSRRKTDR